MLRLRVRSVISFVSFVVLGEWVLFVSTLFSRLKAVFIWSGGFFSEVQLLVLSFLRLSNSLRNFLQCRLLVVISLGADLGCCLR